MRGPSALLHPLASLRTRLALTGRFRRIVWLGRGRQEPLDGAVEALLRESVGPLLVGCGHRESVAEEPVVTEEMIEEAYWLLHPFNSEFDDTREVLIEVYGAMERAKDRSR